MPSPISHTVLANFLPIDKSSPYYYYQRYNIRYLKIGSIGPDIPYGSKMDLDVFNNESDIANLLHFTKSDQNTSLAPNKLPFLGLKLVKQEIRRKEPKRKCDAFFWFIIGYASHVIADGIFHPFVMDKVGRYEGSNKKDHRALEMGIDVFLLEHYTQKSGHAIEASYTRVDKTFRDFKNKKYSSSVIVNFSELIESLFSAKHSSEEIFEWIDGTARLFSFSTGLWPDFLKDVEITRPYVFREMSDLEGKESEYLVLNQPRFWKQNFLNKPEIHLIKDCLPHFNKVMKNFIEKAYSFVYQGGPELNEIDLPAFSLGTGRTIKDPNNIDLRPVLWEAT